MKLVGTRWVAHRERVPKILLDGLQGFVVHTSQVPQGSTQIINRAHQLNTTFTSLKFLHFAKSCAEFLVVQHFSN